MLQTNQSLTDTQHIIQMLWSSKTEMLCQQEGKRPDITSYQPEHYTNPGKKAMCEFQIIQKIGGKHHEPIVRTKKHNS